MKEKILIIDDETDFCLIMKRYFVGKGYEVLLAYNLEDGMTILREFQPNILFLDNNLPDGEGWDAVDKIVETIPQIRVYLVSAHRNKSTLKTPGDNIVVWEKPISFSILNTVF